MLTIDAPAKLNLALEVLGELGEYHEISSILQTVALFDTLTFEDAPDIELSCSEPALQSDNLVERAAYALRQLTNTDRGARIRLEKRIPWPSGLGGGSSDAAATLKGLNALWRLRLSTDELVGVGATLGSDVPAFVIGGTVRLSGRGDVVAPARPLETAYFVIAVPDVPVPPSKTAALYRILGPDRYTDGRYTRAALDSLARSGRVPGDLQHNAFEAVMADCFAGIGGTLDRFRAASAAPVHLAGSGPALYAMYESDDEARRVAAGLAAVAPQVYVVDSVSANDARVALR
jgi:4-diphosphocytidyl-2-C-methyl-D-erythritol kinase